MNRRKQKKSRERDMKRAYDFSKGAIVKGPVKSRSQIESSLRNQSLSQTYFQELEKQYGTLTFGGLLKAWREGEDMNQTAFAKTVGLSVQNLNDLEKGRRIPTPTRAARIAKKLGLPEVGMIQLALRDALLKEGFHYEVKLESA